MGGIGEVGEAARGWGRRRWGGFTTYNRHLLQILHLIYDTYFKFYILDTKHYVGDVDACLKARVLHVNGDMWGLGGLISSNVIYFSVAAE